VEHLCTNKAYSSGKKENKTKQKERKIGVEFNIDLGWKQRVENKNVLPKFSLNSTIT